MDLSAELQYKIAFTIGKLAVPVSVVTMWGIMAFLVIFSIIMTRNMKLVPGKRQMAVEALVGMIYHVLYDILGEGGKRFIPYLGSVMLFLGVANVIGLFGFVPPTKDLNVTVALAIMSILLVEYAGIHKKGVKGWLKSFTFPVAMITPLNVMEVITKPLSLCMRLFGNVLGAFIIMSLIEHAAPIGVPLLASAYFDIFDGLLQAFVFVFLTALYIQDATE